MPTFPKFVAKYGSPSHVVHPSPEVVAKFTPLFPADLIDHWRESGWGGYGDGLLWTVNPDDFAGALNEWLPGQRAYAFARTGLAAIAFWDGHRSRLLDPRFGDTSDLWFEVNAVFENSFTTSDGFLDEVIDRPLFNDALPRLGAPGPDECFGHFPALKIGGAPTAESLQRVKLFEHLALLRQL